MMGMSSRLSCCGTNVAAATMMSSSWRATCIPYCWDSDVLGKADGMAKNINFKVEYKKKTTDVYLTTFFAVLFLSFFSLFFLNVMFFFFGK